MANTLGTATRGTTPFSPEWLKGVGTALIDLVLAQVAFALAGVSFLGVHPFDFLTQWGMDLQQKATEAYATANGAAVTADSAQAAATSATTTQSQQTIAKPGWNALDATADAVFPITNISGTTPSEISVTSSGSVIGFIGTPDNGKKSSIIWLGQNISGITAFYVNLYELNTTTGVATLIEASVSLLSSVPDTLQWNYYNLVNPISSQVGHVYAVEIVVRGTGTYKIAGLPNDWKPANANVVPQQLGAARSTPLAIPAFDLVGTPYSSTTTVSSINATFNGPNVVAGDYVVVWLATQRTNHSSTSEAATYGGATMTLLGSVNLGGGSGTTTGELTAFGIAVDGVTVPAGVQSIHLTATGTLTIQIVDINVAAYSNVGSAGSVVTNGGTGTALASSTVTALTTDRIAHAFAQGGAGSASMALSGYNATQRASQALSQGSSYQLGVLVGDTSGVTTMTFSAASATSATWASLAVVLHSAGVVDAPASFTPTYSGVVPWFGLGGFQFAGPSSTQYSTAGTFTYTIPAWMKTGDNIDLVLLAGGGGGQSAAAYFIGNGGGSGSWFSVTLAYGIDIPIGTTTLTAVVGAGGGGAGGGIGGSGTNGADSTVTGTGVTIVLDATGGPGGGKAGANTGGNQNGLSPNPTTYTFNGITYTPTSNNGKGGTGAGPYGVGSSGNAGEIWLTAYQAGKPNH